AARPSLMALVAAERAQPLERATAPPDPDAVRAVDSDAGASAALSWALVVGGLLASVYAWQSRHPLTTSDFMLFYRSASLPVERMYDPPPGPPRNNMN